MIISKHSEQINKTNVVRSDMTFGYAMKYQRLKLIVMEDILAEGN